MALGLSLLMNPAGVSAHVHASHVPARDHAGAPVGSGQPTYTAAPHSGSSAATPVRNTTTCVTCSALRS